MKMRSNPRAMRNKPAPKKRTVVETSLVKKKIKMKSKNVTRSMVATVTKDKTNEDCQTVPVKVKSGIAKQSLVVPTKVLEKLVKNVNIKVKKSPPKKETKTVNTSSSTSSKVPSTVVKTKVNKKNVIIKPKVQKTKKVDEVDKCTKSASVAKEKKNVAEKKSVKQNVVVKSSEQQKIKVEPPSKIVEEQKPETVVKEDAPASKESTKKSCTASEKNDNKKKDKSTNKSAPPATGKKKSISNINEINTETTPQIKPGENDKDKNVKNGKIPSKKQKKATIVTENKEKPKVEEDAPILPVVQEIKQEPKSVKPPVQKPIPVKIEKKEVPCKKEIKDEKEETISKLIKEASRNISGKGFKKTLVMSWEIQNKSSLAVNKPKTNTKENATKETADAVDCVEKKEIKVEPIETKDIKPVIKSVKQPSGDVAGKIGPLSKKVYSKNISSKITKANKCNAAVKATAVAAVKVKSELNSAPDEEDSHVSDEITLDVLRQHQLKEVKQETLNCVDREEDTATLDDKVNTASTMPAKQKIKVKVESSGDECVTKECQKSVPQAQSRTTVKPSKVRTPLNVSPKQKHKKVKTALTKKAAFKRNVKSKLNPKMVVVKKCIVKPKQGKGSPVGSGNETDHDKKARRKLYSFWNGPKRHRVASLNAIAKVHCLYENESRGALMEMLKQPKVVKPKVVAPPPEPKVPPATRTLRSGPGMRGVGKHWDMHNASFSSSEESSSGQDSSVEYTDKLLVPPPSYKQKQKDAKAKKIEAKNATAKATPAPEVKKRRNRTEIVMDLKDMVVRKRMASLNATAILAASYSPEKRSGKTDSESDDDDDDDDDDDSTEEYDITDKESNSGKKRCYESDSKGDDSGERKVIEVHTNPNNKKVAVIVNQDTDVTITGVYVNSTTRSTHHEGYCSIAGMQYRISATSHTQTNATAVATETLLHQPPPGPDHSVDQPPTPCKSYTPLGALSSMQPPGAPPPAGPPGTSPPIGRRHHGSGSSAFSAPPAPQAPGTYGPPPPTVHGHHPHSHHHHHHHHLPPQGAKVEHPPPPGYIHGYYQPAGPLISAHHSHPHVVAQPSLVSNKTTSAPLSSLEASATPTPPPPVQPPAPSSAGESSDNDVIITATSSGSGEASVAGQPQAPQPPPAPPTLHTYRYSQSYPPPPGSHAAPPGYPYGYAAQYYTTAPGSGSLQYSPQQQQHYHHQDLCYSASSYPPPPTTYFHHKAYGTPPPPGSYHRRYIGPPPAQYYHNNPELYGTTQNAVQQSSQVVTAAAAGTPGSGSTYPPPPGGPPPTIVETYPPPTPTGPVSIVEPYPPPPYYTGYGPGPAGPACYTHSPTRSLAFIDAAYQSCPCPMQSCPKNVHTGPLTGDGKRSNMTSIAKESGLPLPPVALALPLEPASVAGPPSPARGSAGMPPPPSPAGATYQSTSTLKWDTKQESTNEISVSETKQTTEKVRRKARVGKNMVRNTIGFPNGLRQPENTMLLMCHNPNSNRTNEVKRETVTPDSDVIILDDTKDDRVEESTDNVIKPVIEDSEAEECCRQGEDVKDYKRRASCSEDATQKESEEKSPPVTKSDCVELKLAVCKEEVKSEPEEESKMTCIQKLVKAKIEEIKEEKHTSTKRKLTIESIVDGKDDNAKKQKLTKNLSNYKDLIKKTNKSCVKIVNGKRKLTTGQESPKQYLLYKSPKISFAQKSNKKSMLKRKSLGAKEEIPSKKMKSSKPLAASNLHNSKQNVKKTKTHVKEIILSENKEPLVKVTVKKPEQNHKIVKKTAPALLDSLFNKNNVDRTIESVVNSVLFDEPTRKSISELYKDETRPLLTSKTTEAEASNVNKKIVKKVEPPVKIVAKTIATPKCTKTVPKGSGKRKNKVQPQIEVPAPIPKVPRKSFQSPKWSNGWSWEGDPFQGKVFLNSDEPLIVRTCYPAMRHIEGDIISPRDCVLLKAGPRKIDLPFVAKVAALWENPEDGEMMMSLLWYYRPEHTEQGRLPTDQPDEVFASRHKDTNSVACIEDKCYVLTFNEYCRYRKNARRLEEGLEASGPVVPQADGDVYPRAHRQPPATQATAPDLVFFCRRVYDFRQKRIVKNPS